MNGPVHNEEFPATVESAFNDLTRMGWLIARVENGTSIFHPAVGGVAILDSDEQNTPSAVLSALAQDILKTRENKLRK